MGDKARRLCALNNHSKCILRLGNEAARANALHTVGHLMFRVPFRPVTTAAVAGIVPAVAGIAWLFGAVIAQGRELSAVEDMILDLLVGAVVLLSLGWLVLRHQSR